MLWCSLHMFVMLSCAHSSNQLLRCWFLQLGTLRLARRETVRSIWLDNATNFLGARNELQRAFKEIKHDKIKSFLKEDWADLILRHKNAPGASHMGGVWEHQIRSARTILEWLLKSHSHSLNDESLRTLMAEVQLIINSRPLAVETISDSKREILLAPSNLLQSLQWKQVLSCLHQVSLANQMHTQKGDSNMHNILQENFGADGEWNFSRAYSMK